MPNLPDWVYFVLVVFVIPPIVFRTAPRSVVGSLCGWFFLAQPGLIFVLAAVAGYSANGFGWAFVLTPFVALIVFGVFWIVAYATFLDDAGLGVQQLLDQKLSALYEFRWLWRKMAREHDPEWDEIVNRTGTAYLTYLQTEEWHRRRVFMLNRVKQMCQLCGSTVNLEVHHETYARLGNERIEDLTVLCHTCHAGKHATPIARRV